MGNVIPRGSAQPHIGALTVPPSGFEKTPITHLRWTLAEVWQKCVKIHVATTQNHSRMPPVAVLIGNRGTRRVEVDRRPPISRRIRMQLVLTISRPEPLFSWYLQEHEGWEPRSVWTGTMGTPSKKPAWPAKAWPFHTVAKRTGVWPR
jgi:hypothetical protein